MKTVIISGINGFVGRETAKYFVDNDYYVIGITRDDTNLSNKSNILIFNEFQLQSKIVIDNIASLSPKIFINLAWRGTSGVLRSELDTQLLNISTLHKYLILAKELKCEKFVSAGSIMEKEVLYFLRCCNSNIMDEKYIYGLTKLYAHYLSKMLMIEYNLPVSWVTITNVYGVGDYSMRLINSTIDKLIKGERITFSKCDQIYDFVNVKDVAKALYVIAEKGIKGKDYTIASNPAPLKKFLIELNKIITQNELCVFKSEHKYPCAELTLEDFDLETLHFDTGFYPEIPFRQGIKETYNWYLKTIKCKYHY